MSKKNNFTRLKKKPLITIAITCFNAEKTLERGQIIGFVIVMGLMVIIFGNDIWNLIKG